MKTFTAAALALSLGMAPITAHAWGAEGHQIVAQIARAYMTPVVLAKVDTLLAGDTTNHLTPHDMASEAVWADVYRGAGHRETAEWHFINLELDKPDIAAACFNFPSLGGRPASEGPADDCITDKITEFAEELSNPATTSEERITALRFVLHFMGDIHQPLHAADNHDRGANCVQLALGGPRTQNLHSYWDTGLVEAIGTDTVATSRMLVAAIKPEQAKMWSSGGPKTWAAESFDIARTSVYTIGSKPGCDGGQGPVTLPAGYADAAKIVVTQQLQKAGFRLALMLNNAFS